MVGIASGLLLTAAIVPLILAQPNILILLADDVGVGDIECFGNSSIPTPNINRLCREGVKLSHHAASASLCTPSRAALLTGRDAFRVGFVPSKQRVFLELAIKGGLSRNEITLAELAQQSGYRTALIGKWHLGLSRERVGDNWHHPLSQGFDSYYGVPLTNLPQFGPQQSSERRFRSYPTERLIFNVILIVALFLSTRLFLKRPRLLLLVSRIALASLLFGAIQLYVREAHVKLLSSFVMRNHSLVEHPIRLDSLSDRFVDEAVSFMSTSVHSGRRFLLMMSFLQGHTALVTSPRFSGLSSRGPYGDMMIEMDNMIGRLLSYLDQSDLTSDTFIYFTSDHGAMPSLLGYDGKVKSGSNGIFRGHKYIGGLEGGLRVPGVVMWPTRLPSNQTLSVPTSLLDLCPTVADLVAARTNTTLDGLSLIPVMNAAFNLSLPETNLPPPNLSPHDRVHSILLHLCGDILHAIRFLPTALSRSNATLSLSNYVNHDGPVYKLLFKEPKYYGRVGCDDSFYNDLSPPHLFDIVSDPTESNPIGSDSALYKELVPGVLEVASERLRLMREEQARRDNAMSASNLRYRLHLQPVCGTFPDFTCRED